MKPKSESVQDTRQRSKLDRGTKEVNQSGVVTNPVVALPSYPRGRSAKKCTGRNFCRMWSVNRLEWSDLTNAVEMNGKEQLHQCLQQMHKGFCTSTSTRTSAGKGASSQRTRVANFAPGVRQAEQRVSYLFLFCFVVLLFSFQWPELY